MNKIVVDITMFIVGILVGYLLGVFRTEQSIHKHTRLWVKMTKHCYLCPDCPDGCPRWTPDDPQNNPERN